MENNKKPVEVEHHQQQELCTNRPVYRQGRKLTAVKTYTISTESRHLFIYGVPKINLRNELKKLCQGYGQIIAISAKEDYKTELFTECYHIHYQRIQSARIAKRFLDNKSFYGGILHVCYAPEFETVEETGQKLLQRIRDVMNRLNQHTRIPQTDNEGNGSLQDAQGSSQQYTNSYNNEYHSQPNWIHTSEASSSSVLQQNNFPEMQGSPGLNYNEYGNLVCPQQRDTTQQQKDDTSKHTVETKLSKKRPQQTPAYFWKDASESSNADNKPGKKRSGNFVPRQVTKKKRYPET